MIRKRIKKRRNPYEEEELRERRLTGYLSLSHVLSDSIKHGNPEELVNAIILYKQGLTCNDCDKHYYECECEKCPDCGFRQNLCYLDIDYKGPRAEVYFKEERKRVKEAGYELLLEILTDDVYNDGRKYTIIPNIEYKKLYKLKKEFLNIVLQKDNINLSGAILSEMNLSKIKLSGANLNKILAFSTDLSGADLSGADLSEAELRVSNLSYSNLTGANLSYSNLTGANLTGAELYGANFINTTIKNTKFTYAQNINYTHDLNFFKS